MSRHGPSRMAGFSLVELMVALTVGLLLLAGILQILLSNRQSFDSQQATAQVQDNLRLAEFVLSHSIAHAGFRVELDRRPMDSFPADGTPPAFPAGAVVAGQENTEGQSDTLRVRYLSRGGIRNCRGAEIGDQQNTAIADFEFYVNANRSLICHVIGSDRQPIAENVMRFEISYGLDTDNVPGVNRYVGTLDSADQNAVRSVRVQLLLASEDNAPSLPRAITRTFNFADDSTETFNDRRIYMLMDETIALPNEIE